MKNPILFLDANAHVPMSAFTLNVYTAFSNSTAAHGHPLSPSVPGRAAAGVLEEARTKIAELIGAKEPGQIVFTHSCTQACQWVARIAARYSELAFMSPTEHPASSQAVEECFDHVIKLDVRDNGQVMVPYVLDGPDAVFCIHMQNEIGTINAIQDMRGLNGRGKLVSDMSQSLGKMDINVTELDVDLAVFGGHKFGGPSGVGFIYLKDTSDWEEFGTGSRYYMDIPGTPNVGAIVATAAALDEAVRTLDERTANMVAFRDALEPGLEELGFDIIGKDATRCPNTTFVKVPGKRSAGLLLMNKLGKLGIHVGLGSACGSLYTGGSPLMQALGRPSDGQDYVRISQWGEYGAKEAKVLLEAIRGTIQ